MEIYKESKAAELKEHMNRQAMKQHERAEKIDRELAHKMMKGL